MKNQDFCKCKLKEIDVKDINLSKVFLHYTPSSNIGSIAVYGLQSKIGENSKGVEKTKKIFFSIGDKGALVIIDVWIKWLIAKPKNKLLYQLGIILYNIPYFNIFVHKLAKILFKETKKKKYWACSEMKKILENSVYLVLDLKENEDFCYKDIDELKKKSKFASKYFKHIYSNDSDFLNSKMEYWNMHTFSNKNIEVDKIALLKMNNEYSVNEILKYIASKNKEYIKDNLELLNYYLNI